jgi:hypothetical protein
LKKLIERIERRKDQMKISPKRREVENQKMSKKRI